VGGVAPSLLPLTASISPPVPTPFRLIFAFTGTLPHPGTPPGRPVFYTNFPAISLILYILIYIGTYGTGYIYKL
jgi:hypothetical protein